ncbi:MAG: FKBP-type peptidyl-prolyl cis-trans isomerase [Woeseiaceae bacterium]|nr:FKBP-type peptidyl-prolyl cis-trans isomerase [Woeseiaceae bacterium]
MKNRLTGLAALLVLAACGQGEQPADDAATTTQQKPNASAEPVELVPGLTYVTIRNGSGRMAVPGDEAEVHYTGWLFDPNAEDNRGEKFDSSIDRGAPFPFKLGAGRVISGWDQGVAGMLIGEKRVLTIAPELAYGERQRGPIPANSTLIFEVDLLGLRSPSEEATEPE